MFILSMRMSAIKVLCFCTLVLALTISAVVVIIGVNDTSATSQVVNKKVSYKVKSNEDRIAFLRSFGWEVEEEPHEVAEVIIPTEFNDVYDNYNSIQKKQGLDLEKFKGKRVKRYTYTVTNYPDHKEKIYADILVSNNKIIAGDICSVALNGFMHGFALDGAT